MFENLGFFETSGKTRFVYFDFPMFPIFPFFLLGALIRPYKAS